MERGEGDASDAISHVNAYLFTMSSLHLYYRHTSVQSMFYIVSFSSNVCDFSTCLVLYGFGVMALFFHLSK